MGLWWQLMGSTWWLRVKGMKSNFALLLIMVWGNWSQAQLSHL